MDIHLHHIANGPVFSGSSGHEEGHWMRLPRQLSHITVVLCVLVANGVVGKEFSLCLL